MVSAAAGLEPTGPPTRAHAPGRKGRGAEAGRKQKKSPAVGAAKPHRPGPRVEQPPIEAPRGPERPVRRRGVGAPAPTPCPARPEPCHDPGTAPRLDGH